MTQPRNELSDEALVSSVLLGHDADGSLVNVLLGRLYDGADVRMVVPLLESGDARAIGGGLFIASELGTRVAPLLDHVLKQRQHHDTLFRALVVDAIGEAAAEAPAAAVAVALESLLDDATAVRYAAAWYLLRTSLPIIGKGLPLVRDRGLASALSGFLQQVSRGGRADVLDASALDRLPREQRLLALLAAARTGDRTSLTRLAESRDALVRSISRELLSGAAR